MLLIEDGSISYDPERLQLTLRGKQIELMVRPLDDNAVEECREKARVYKFAENPETKKTELGSLVDSRAFDVELFDHMIAGFSGIGTAKDKPLPVTRENKAKLVYLKPGEGEEPLSTRVIRFAQELAKKRHEAREAELKNS